MKKSKNTVSDENLMFDFQFDIQVITLLARARFSQNQENLLVLKMGKKISRSSEKRAQIVALSKLNFFCT